MQQRDTTKSDQAQGLYERYRVERIDGQADADGTRYFVLRTTKLTNDQPETAALRAFAGSVERTHPQLAADLRALLPDSSFPLSQRMKGTIAALRANYSKSAAEAALADLEAALPLIAAHTGQAEAPNDARANRERVGMRLQAALDAAPDSPDWAYAGLVAAGREAVAVLRVSHAQTVNGPHLSGFLQGLDAGVEVSQARARPLPPDLVTRAAEVAHALEQGNADVSLMPIDEEAEIYGEKTVVQTAVKVLRDIIAAVEASTDTTLETRFTEVHYAVDGAGGPRTVFRFEGLPDVSVPDTDADKLVAQHVRESGLKNKVAAAICNNSNFPEPMRVHVLGRDLGEPASSVVAEAADALSEAGEALRGEASNMYWLVDEYNDTEGETFGIAVRASREVDRALSSWATSYEALLAAEHGMTPNPVVIGRKLTNGGDALTFLKGLTSADLEAIENGSDNDYGARVRILSAEGTRVLLDAINDMPLGGSLSLYKGNLSTCMPELEDAEQPVPEPTELADLWVYEEKGAWEETDEPPQLGEHDADLAATAVPDQPGTLEAVYHQQGWSLVLAQDGRSTHLFRRDDKVGVMFVGPVACGANVVLGEIVKPLSERFDYPPHPELCARCCVVANDRR